MAINWGNKETVAQKEAKASEAAYQQWKMQRQAAVDAIKVEVDGMVFDGDEYSTSRMADNIAAADDLTGSIEWTLADNSAVIVTVQQLKAACRLACEQRTRIWNEGRS